jgi:hypothetical protein
MAREISAGVAGSEGRGLDAAAHIGAVGGIVWVVGMGEGKGAGGNGPWLASGSDVSSGRAVDVYAGETEVCEGTEGDGCEGGGA